MFASGVIVLVGVGACMIALIVLHLLPTGLSPLRDAVSHYGITEQRLGYRIQTIAMGVAGLAAAWGLARAHVGKAIVVALAAFGVARLMISWFPMDAPGAQRTLHGIRHVVFAVIAFLGVTIAATRLAANLRRATCWPDASRVLEPLGWAVLAGLVIMIVSRRAQTPPRWFGLGERVFYVSVLVWLAALGSQLVR